MLQNASEHNWHCNGNSCAYVQGGCVLVDDSIEVWGPVVESAWHRHSSLPGCQQPHSGWLSLPGSAWLEHSSSPGCQQPHSGWLSLPGSICDT